MSVTLLATAKTFLNVIHSADDVLLQQLLDSAEAEALNFMDRDDFGDVCSCDSSSYDVSSDVSSETIVMPADVQTGVLILLQATYQASPDEMQQLRDVAEVKLMPYRCRLGV
ncbi:phage gp6-like head-tail connector protein [Aestuariicella hydrocarbonica]|uniref:Phage gp6-like head-tail connector protein n=1 Tax=Pseudomaricurvus hydrocarbonicus TaxID=1470433 RepID=A0A9E5JQ82_9GAMM|nr:head-tail connector protein [Aestuariicella hydrocarbonica]NHO64623.1 phage gp6-like head-tail connector protein [Aestuariicella hydrocarbonica]